VSSVFGITPTEQTVLNSGSSTTSSSSTTGGTVSQATGINFTDGWYVFIACASGILFSGVPVVGEILLGVLGIALIYQLGLLLQGK
jgi:hypothetical protein